MNIGELARMTGVTPDTLRYYEREKLLDAPARAANGYRSYDNSHVARVRFVRSAQALGFSLAEIRWIVPRLAAGLVDRSEIERHLKAKLDEINAHMRQLRALKQELLATFGSLRCEPTRTVSVEAATAMVAPAPRRVKPVRPRLTAPR
jgi:MerR family transcriptional regulator, copper efflux regulator